MRNSLFRKIVAVAGLMPFCMVASAGNMSAGEVHAVFNGLEWQKGNGTVSYTHLTLPTTLDV